MQSVCVQDECLIMVLLKPDMNLDQAIFWTEQNVWNVSTGCVI